VEAGEVEAEALKIARTIAELPAEAVAISRDLIRGSSDEIIARIDAEGRFFAERLKSDEAKAAFQAFFDRAG
jgi:hypothetical protein